MVLDIEVFVFDANAAPVIIEIFFILFERIEKIRDKITAKFRTVARYVQSFRRPQGKHDLFKFCILLFDFFVIHDGIMSGEYTLRIFIQIGRIRKTAPSHKGTCRNAETEIFPSSPIIEIVAGFEPLLCEVGDLVPLEPKPLQIGAGAVVVTDVPDDAVVVMHKPRILVGGRDVTAE